MMIILIEKGFHALVFAIFFVALAFTFDTLAPSKPDEIYELYNSYINTLWLISLFFVTIFLAMLVIAIASKYGVFQDIALAASKSNVVLGYAINSMGLICIVYFVIHCVVFPW
jgi:hypothetical protein